MQQWNLLNIYLFYLESLIKNQGLFVMIPLLVQFARVNGAIGQNFSNFHLYSLLQLYSIDGNGSNKKNTALFVCKTTDLILGYWIALSEKWQILTSVLPAFPLFPFQRSPANFFIFFLRIFVFAMVLFS